MNAAAATLRHDPWLPYAARIRDVTSEVAGVSTYELELSDMDAAGAYRFRPGQFNMLYLPGVGEIAISISGDPGHPTRLPHTIRVAGNVTQTLARLGPGSSLGLRGPFGVGWPMEQCRGKDVVLVAGGIGLAPLRPAVYELLASRGDYGKLALLCGARTAEGLLYPLELTEWPRQGLRVETTVDRATGNWRGHVGVVTLLLERLDLPRPRDTVLLTCGPEVMMWYVAQTALARGLAPQSIWVSLERNMSCAVGLCGHCQLGPEFICKDGPVFRYDRVASLLKVEKL